MKTKKTEDTHTVKRNRLRIKYRWIKKISDMLQLYYLKKVDAD